MTFAASARRIAEAKSLAPGGVNSNFRLGISPTPLVVERGEGPYLFDADGNRLIDYYLGMGPMILGHNPRPVIDAIKAQLESGILFAAQTEIEYEAATLVKRLVPCAERVRFSCSGSEAVQAAIRLARAATGRPTIVKFEGHYHGWLDNVVWSVAPQASEMGERDAPAHVPGSNGQDPNAGATLDIVVWNDLDRLATRLRRGDVAGVIMEPIMCNTSVIAPKPGYLDGVRKLCSETGTVLIFDEVITGFRVAAGGAQALLGVTPDLAVYGKAIANGMPVSAVAGRADIMDLMVTGKVMHGGTYNAHPLCMAATAATLNSLLDGSIYARIEARGRRLMEGFERILRDRQIAGRVQGLPGIFHVSLGRREPIGDYRDQLATDKAAYVRLTTALLTNGVRALERGAWFLSDAHDDATVDATLAAFDRAVVAARP
ncbi:MAG: aminotransferase class III-fold pyridoxal phosphate-dependent enzyme [Alphaproteobacteria bacterium]|nr:aminotransferase class III-fold pyridoxal phosphate-dependent enzyme [Alphaproteobacteria bacterium]